MFELQLNTGWPSVLVHSWWLPTACNSILDEPINYLQSDRVVPWKKRHYWIIKESWINSSVDFFFCLPQIACDLLTALKSHLCTGECGSSLSVSVTHFKQGGVTYSCYPHQDVATRRQAGSLIVLDLSNWSKRGCPPKAKSVIQQVPSCNMHFHLGDRAEAMMLATKPDDRRMEGLWKAKEATAHFLTLSEHQCQFIFPFYDDNIVYRCHDNGPIILTR